MNSITVYHATNKSISEIGIDKKTMFFTDSESLARMWGQDHYDDFMIITTELPINKINEFVPLPGRECYADHDFERLELFPFEGEIIYYDEVNHGYIVKDVNKFKLDYL